MKTSKENIADVIAGCLKNDRNAQRNLYEMFASTMLGVCMGYTHSKEEAEDIMIEGFMIVFTKLDTFREESSLESWIRRIMVNNAINHYRYNKKYLLNDSIEESKECVFMDNNPNHDIQTKLEAKQILEIMESMPEDYRLILNLRIIEGFSFKEMSEKLERNDSTLRVYYQRACTWLQERIQAKEKE